MRFGSGQATSMFPLRRRSSRVEGSEALIAEGTTAPKSSNVLSVEFYKTWRFLKRLFSGHSLQDEFSYRAIRRPSLYTVILHLVPVAGAVVVIFFNLYGYWVGKELSGRYGQNGPKQLALQSTAKVHELLMLASLAEMLLTHVLKSLAVGYGLPFGSLTIATKFKSLSYIWSRDFGAMCMAQYPRKGMLVMLILICTLLSFAVGPSSATALIPRVNIWPAGEAIMTISGMNSSLWPQSLDSRMSDLSSCNNSTLGCLNPAVWDSIGANLFSFWGRETATGATVSPQRINVPGLSSLRSMEVRTRNSFGPENPTFAAASVQHAVMADMVNTFRFLTFPSRSTKCRRTWSPAMCSYQDVSWFVDAMQPLVLTACAVAQPNTSVIVFPPIRSTSVLLQASEVESAESFTIGTSSSFSLVPLDEENQRNASTGIIISLGSDPNVDSFACTVQAHWIKLIVAATYIGGHHVINSKFPSLSPTIVDEAHWAQPINITPQWVQQSIQNSTRHDSNSTAFEDFLQTGEPQVRLSAKLEAILATIFAENMAHSGFGTVPLSISSTDLYLTKRGTLLEGDPSSSAPTSRTDQTPFKMQTTMTGYGYGLHTASGLSSSVLISLIVLLTYSILILAHLASLYLSEEPYIQSWRDEKDMLVTCLQSRFEPSITRVDTEGVRSHGSRWQKHQDGDGILKDTVLFTSRRGWAELSFREKARVGED